MIRLLLTAATVSGLLRHVFGGEKRASKPKVGRTRKRKPARRASRPAAR
jgi:hypothetical protein